MRVKTFVRTDIFWNLSKSPFYYFAIDGRDCGLFSFLFPRTATWSNEADLGFSIQCHRRKHTSLYSEITSTTSPFSALRSHSIIRFLYPSCPSAFVSKTTMPVRQFYQVFSQRRSLIYAAKFLYNIDNIFPPPYLHLSTTWFLGHLPPAFSQLVTLML